MKTQNFFALDDDGSVYRVQQTVTPITINEDLMRAAMKDSVGCVTKKLASAGVISSLLVGEIGIAATTVTMVAWSRVGLMPMNVRTSTSGGFIYPEFSAKTGPVINLQWRPPDSMRLYFVTQVNLMNFTIVDNYLVAIDKSNNFWRLPISNLFAELRVCTGDFDKQGSTVLDCIGRSWDHFAKSPYNDHLANDGGAGRTEIGKEMFKFKPLENEGMETVPYTGDWTKLCSKVGNEFLLTHIAI